MNSILNKLLAYILPYTCVFCGKSAEKRDLCASCYTNLPWINRPCQICGQTLPDTLPENSLCGSCIVDKKAFDRTVALFHYDDHIAQAIIALKFHHQLKYAKLLSDLLLEKLLPFYSNTAKPDVIIPIPLHVDRLRERGFNQALELAKPLAKHFKKPLLKQNMTRIRATQAQTAVSAKERYANLKNAFKVSENLTGLHIAVVDDVMTTTHTANQFSQALRKAGAAKIDIWCCARTMNHEYSSLF